MNVRRMVLVMLVMGCLVQGASALDSIVLSASAPAGNYSHGESPSDSDSFQTTPEYFGATATVLYRFRTVGDTGCTAPNVFYARASATGASSTTGCQGTEKSGSPTYVLSGSSELLTASASAYIFCSACGANFFELVTASANVIYTFSPVHTASGASCTGGGSYDIFINHSFDYSDSLDGDYSFTIADGINYQIYYSDDDVWHNFTATTSDHTWNPPCSLPSISGTITALDGEGIYNLNVTLHDFYLYERDLVDSMFTGTDGSYIFYINTSDDAGPFALSVSGYCNNGENCSAFRIEAPINVGDESYTFDYTWHIPQNIRIDLQYENGSAVPGALLNMKDLPGSVGVWKTTATDGYTTYTSLQSSKVYVDYHGGDNSSGGSAGSDVLHSFQLVPNGQYRWSQFVLSIPDDYVNNTTIPPILPPVDEVNKTDISDMITDSTFVVSVNDVLGAPIPQATVTASAADKNYSGKFTGFTNTSGQWSFPKNSTVGQYDVSAAMTCFLPQTKTRFNSAEFTLLYSCDTELPGQDENGTGGWKSNNSYSNWTMNGTPSDEATTKTKLTSWLTYFMYAIIIMMMLTYFTKK